MRSTKKWFAASIFILIAAAVLYAQTYSFGVITATTPSPGDNSTNVATTAFVATSFAPLASPAFTGTPTAPTASVGTSSTQIATTAFVTTGAGTSNVPRPNIKRWAYLCTDGSTTPANTPCIGDKFGTFSTAGSASTSLATSTNPSLVAVSSGAGNGDQGLAFGNLGFAMGRNIRVQMYASVSAYTNNSLTAYLGDSTAKLVPTVGGNYIGFKAVSGTDTNFQCVTRDGTTVTSVDSGVVANTSFRKFEIIVNDSVPNATFYIDGSQVCLISTHLPAAGTMLRWAVAAFVITGSASVNVNWAWSYVESDL